MSLPVYCGIAIVIGASAALSSSQTPPGVVPEPAHFITTFGEGVVLAVGSFLVSWGMLRAKSAELDRRMTKLEDAQADKANCDDVSALTRRVDRLYEGGERRSTPR